MDELIEVLINVEKIQQNNVNVMFNIVTHE